MSHVMTSQHLFFFLIEFGMPVEIAAYLPISLSFLSLSLSHTHRPNLQPSFSLVLVFFIYFGGLNHVFFWGY